MDSLKPDGTVAVRETGILKLPTDATLMLNEACPPTVTLRADGVAETVKLDAPTITVTPTEYTTGPVELLMWPSTSNT